MGSRLGRGKVIRLILDEVFGIDKEFAVETETMFDKFYVERDRFLANPIDQGALISEGQHLANRSQEIRTIAFD
jgi:hypothetical protein